MDNQLTSVAVYTTIVHTLAPRYGGGTASCLLGWWSFGEVANTLNFVVCLTGCLRLFLLSPSLWVHHHCRSDTLSRRSPVGDIDIDIDIMFMIWSRLGWWVLWCSAQRRGGGGIGGDSSSCGGRRCARVSKQRERKRVSVCENRRRDPDFRICV